MKILCLLDRSPDVTGHNWIVVPRLANELKDALVADFPGADVNTAKIEHNFTQQTFLDDGEYLWVGGGIDDYLFD